MAKGFFAIGVVFCVSLGVVLGQDLSASEKAGVESFKLAPSYFIANTASQKTGKRLVDDAQVTAFVQTQKGRVLFTPSGAYIGMTVAAADPFEPNRNPGKRALGEESEGQASRVVLKAGFADAQAQKRGIVPRLEDVTPGTVNFMLGAKENWRTQVPTYKMLVYDQVWPGISLEYLGYMDHLEFRLLLDPGSHPADIALETGGEHLHIREDGSLSIALAGAELVMSRPFAYQIVNGQKLKVPIQYQIQKDNQLGFKVGEYDPTQALIIDPTLTWSTYLGGPGGLGFEVGRAIAVDSLGNAFVAGNSPSGDFPTTPGAYQENWRGGQNDAFVSKLSSDGSELIYSTYLGGTGEESGEGIAVDNLGNTFVTGYTNSIDFPKTIGAFDEIQNGKIDAFVSKLNVDGSVLVYSTFLGGVDIDYGHAIAVDLSGNAYVTGETLSHGFPMTFGSYDDTYNGSWDVFVCRLDSEGSGLIYSTFLGGTSNDYGFGIAVDVNASAYVTGHTFSSGFPTTVGSYDRSLNGSSDVFVTKLNSDGSELDYSTFLGGSGSDAGYGIALDGSGNAYVSGWTYSEGYPTTAGAFDETYNGNWDVFVSKLNNFGSGLIYSTFLGGSSEDYGNAIAVDSAGNAFVTGYTSSNGYPTTIGAYDESYNFSPDGFVSKLSVDGSVLTYSTFFGGAGGDYADGIAVDVSGRAYVTGRTNSNNFPTTAGALNETPNNEWDVFMLKLSSDGTELSYSTFLGGSGTEYGNAIAVDTFGNTYLTGLSDSGNFPVSTGSFDETQNGDVDVFVSKLTSDAYELSYSTFLGGKGYDCGRAITVDDNTGNVLVTGQTNSIDYPTTSGSLDEHYNGGFFDAFVSKLSPDGSELNYSTYIGGSGYDSAIGIKIDNMGNAYLTGNTLSNDFPTTSGAYDETYNGNWDVFVCKLNIGNGLSYSTYLGGSDNDQVNGIAINILGNAYVVGDTQSSDFPSTKGAYDETFNGIADVFVSKLSWSGSDLSFSTFLGSPGVQHGFGICVDLLGNAYVTGDTNSSAFPTTTGAYDETFNGGYSDAFVSKLSLNGNGLIYSTFLGGTDNDYGNGISVDAIGNAYVIGNTLSIGFPTTNGSFSNTNSGSSDVFLSFIISDGSRLGYSTYLGGSGDDSGAGIAVDQIGNAYITGSTFSSDFPTTSGSYDETQNGYGDAFVTKFNLCSLSQLPLWPDPVTVLDLTHCLQ